MAEPVQNVQVISAEARRRLSPVTFTSNQLTILELPRDTVLKRASITMSGTFSVTYAAGAPVADDAGSMARLCPRLDVIINGQDTVKSLDLNIQRMVNLLARGILPPRSNSTSAGAFTTKVAGTEAANGAPFAYPATTQFVLVNEACEVYFENPFGYNENDRFATLLNLKGVSSAEMRFNFTDISNLQRYEAAPVAITYGAIDIQFAVNLVEAQEIPASAQFFYNKETVKRVQYSSESRQALVDLPRGNALAGIGLFVRNGDANKSPSDIALDDIGMIINGSRIIQRTKFLDLQADNRMKFGALSPRSSGAHQMRGFAWMNLLKAGRIDSAIVTTQQAGVDQVQLELTTRPSSGTDAATYTNPVEVSIWTQEISAAPKKV